MGAVCNTCDQADKADTEITTPEAGGVVAAATISGKPEGPIEVDKTPRVEDNVAQKVKEQGDQLYNGLTKYLSDFNFIMDGLIEGFNFHY